MNSPLKVIFFSAIVLLCTFFSAHPAKAYYPQERVTNGNFENDPVGTSWNQVPTNSNTIGELGVTWHGGTRGTRLGLGPKDVVVETGASLQYIYSSNFTIPSSATSVTFSYWYNLTSDEAVTGQDALSFTIVNNANSEPLCGFRADAALVSRGVWLNNTCDASLSKGKSVHLLITLTENNTGPTIAYIDDVSIIAEYPDATAPTTSFSSTPLDPNSCSFTVAPTITLSAVDDVGGSGLASVFYQWNGGSYAAYTGPLQAPKGSNTVYYYATDVSGNIESVHSQTIQFGDTRSLAVRLAEANKDIVVDTNLTNRLRGRILLQVQKNGEAWYLNPKDGRRYFLCRPASAFLVMRKLGLGITNANLKKIPRYNTGDIGDPVLTKRLLGRILLQVERNGEAWYLYPVNGKRNYMGRPSDAFSLMRLLGLGITNANLNKIPIGLLE